MIHQAYSQRLLHNGYCLLCGYIPHLCGHMLHESSSICVVEVSLVVFACTLAWFVFIVLVIRSEEEAKVTIHTTNQIQGN